MTKDFLGDRRRTLEERFYHQREAAQLEAMRAKAERERSTAELAEATGFQDEKLVEALVALGVTVDTLAALSIVPMVHVAWIDRTLTKAERDAVLGQAHASGIREGTAAYALMQGWLERAPDAALFDAWKAYHHELAKHLDPAARKALRDELVPRAERVARASGGLLGIGSISTEEQAVLDEVQAVLEG